MGNAVIQDEVFVNRSLQIVIAGHVNVQGQAVPAQYMVRSNLWTAAAVVVFERAVDVATRAIGVHFAARRPAITQDAIAKRLRRD